jgi:hypothetical protein
LNYDIFDRLQELFKMLQCTPTQHNNKKNKNKKKQRANNGNLKEKW